MENEIPSLGDIFLKTLNSSEKFGIYIYTTNGQIAYANKAFCNMTGYSEHELLNNIKLSDMLDGENKQEAIKNMDRHIKDENFL